MLTSVAQPKPRILFTIGWCTTFRRNLISSALGTWHVILPNLFQQHKTEVSCPPLCSAMSARRSRKATEPPKLVRPPEFGTCNFYVEAVGPAFDPKRFLLRHLFPSDCTPLETTNPSWNSEPYKNGSTFLILNDQQVKTMAENLPRMCESVCGQRTIRTQR